MRSTIILVLTLLIFIGCKTREESDSVSNEYVQGIEKWQQNRIASLTKPDGWTTLIGLYWLKEGSQTFGSAENNDIVFPQNAPANIGTFTLEGDSVLVHLSDTSSATLIGLENTRQTRVIPDVAKGTTYMNYRSLTWYLIERGGKYGVRLKDSLSEQRLNLKEIPHYPIDERWKFKATFIPPDSGATIEIENILGQVSDNPLEGKLEFTYQGKNHQIAALNGGSNAYFLIIADETTGEETYGGGRYMYVDRADSTGTTIIDFNKAYNPPCVFSEFATCPLPPKENFLPFRITAGEKEVPHH